MASNKCKPVEVTVKGDIKEILAEVQKEAAKKDLIFKGDERKGTIKHKSIAVKGVYKVSGKKIKVEMFEDTWLVSCERLEQGVRDFFKGK